jgi:hypothetical protein
MIAVLNIVSLKEFLDQATTVNFSSKSQLQEVC